MSSDPGKKTVAGHLINLSSMLMEEMSKLIWTAVNSGTASPEQDNDTSIDILEHLLRLRLFRLVWWIAGPQWRKIACGWP